MKNAVFGGALVLLQLVLFNFDESVSRPLRELVSLQPPAVHVLAAQKHNHQLRARVQLNGSRETRPRRIRYSSFDGRDYLLAKHFVGIFPSVGLTILFHLLNHVVHRGNYLHEPLVL